MSFVPLILVLLPAVLPVVAGAEDPPTAAAREAGRGEGTLVVSRGEGRDPVVIPRDEELDYVVEIDVGMLGDLRVGRVSLSAGHEPYRAGLPPPGADVASEPPRRVGWIQSRASGAYLGYELRHELEARHLPQAWPSLLYRDTQAGSENRRRELKAGVLDGKTTALYRHDGHCKGCRNPEHFVESNWLWGKPYHCEKCKSADHRVWSPAQSREIPEGSVDLLTAVFLARSMIQDGRKEMTFPVVDKQKLWVLTVTRGPEQSIETPAGKFRCALAQLATRAPPSEPGDPRETKEFEGLFGIHGAIRIWMQADTGVPVMISGELPVPVIDTLQVNVRLESYRGTPALFKPYR